MTSSTVPTTGSPSPTASSISRATIDHIRTHVETAREPIDRVAKYAYERVEPSGNGSEL